MLRALIAALPLLPVLAHAHGGHGQPGVSHWHATDTWGLLVVAGGVMAMAWFSRRK